MDEMGDTLHAIAAMFNNAPDILTALRKSIDENAGLKKQVEDYFNERVAMLTKKVLEDAKTVNGIKIAHLTGIRMPDAVKNVAFGVRAASPENTVFIGATVDTTGKPLLTLMITEDLVKSHDLNAGKIVREAAKAIKGGGGGQPGFAQAGGKDADGISLGTQAIIEALH